MRPAWQTGKRPPGRCCYGNRLGSIVLAYFIDTHIVEKNTIFGINLLISKATTIFWLYVELKSIDETSQKLGNKPFLDIINGIVKWLKSFKKDINEIKE